MFDQKSLMPQGVFRVLLILSFLLLMLALTACDISQQTSGLDKSEIDQDVRLSDEELQILQQQNNSSITDDPTEFLFGFDLRSSPQEDARQYLPFLQYLEAKTSYKFQLRFTPQDGKIVEDLGAGKIHFAAIGAVSLIQAAQRYKVEPIVRGLNTKNKAEYRSFIITRPDSKIKKLSDLHGKVMAFGSVSSTQGHLIPRIVLAEHDINLKSFSSFVYTGSHLACANAVISGRADACGLQDTMASDLAAREKASILFKSDYYPSSGIAVNSNIVAREVIDKIRQALIDFKPNGPLKAKLYHWRRTEMPNGFERAAYSDYKLFEDQLRKLGLLDE